MSYYMGDYYAGDPGIGSFLSGLVKGIPVVGQLASAVVSPIARLVGGSRTSAMTSLARPIVQNVGSALAKAKSVAAGAGALAAKHPVLTAAGAAGAAGVLATGLPKGSRAAAGMSTTGMAGMRTGRKRRRMNVANGRALARATRRLHAFARRYRKVVGFVSPHRPKGRIYFKKRRRAAA